LYAEHAQMKPSEEKKLNSIIEGVCSAKVRTEGTNIITAATAAVAPSCAPTRPKTLRRKPRWMSPSDSATHGAPKPPLLGAPKPGPS